RADGDGPDVGLGGVGMGGGARDVLGWGLARNPSRCALRWAPVRGSAASDRSTGPDPPAPAPTTSNHRRIPMPDAAHLNQTAPSNPTTSSTPNTAEETPPYGGQATGAAPGGANAPA